MLMYVPGGASGKEPTWVQSLGLEDPMEEGMATHPSILAWRFLIDRGAWFGYSSWRPKESDTTEHKHACNVL